MEADGSYIYFGAYCIMYRLIEPLCHTLENNITSYVNYTFIKNKWIINISYINKYIHAMENYIDGKKE